MGEVRARYAPKSPIFPLSLLPQTILTVQIK